MECEDFGPFTNKLVFLSPGQLITPVYNREAQ